MINLIAVKEIKQFACSEQFKFSVFPTEGSKVEIDIDNYTVLS